eukprot:scaffold846_cov252-Pinguiococcus_pyrenoidosus.AAC.31
MRVKHTNLSKKRPRAVPKGPSAPPKSRASEVLHCLYTHQKTKKRKTYKEGFLKIFPARRRALLYKSEADLRSGSALEACTHLAEAELLEATRTPDTELDFERHIVIVGERHGATADSRQPLAAIEAGSTGRGEERPQQAVQDAPGKKKRLKFKAPAKVLIAVAEQKSMDEGARQQCLLNYNYGQSSARQAEVLGGEGADGHGRDKEEGAAELECLQREQNLLWEELHESASLAGEVMEEDGSFEEERDLQGDELQIPQDNRVYLAPVDPEDEGHYGESSTEVFDAVSLDDVLARAAKFM